MKTDIRKTLIISLLVVLPVIVLINVDFSGIYVLVHPIAKTLHLSLNQVSWVVTLYLLFFAAPTILGGRLGDLFGSRNVLFAGLVLFIFTSLFCGLAQHEIPLLIARALQGFAGALMWPNVTTIGFNAFSVEKKAFGIGVVTSAVGFGLAVGPIYSGLIAHYLSWHWVFLLNVPIITIVAVITLWNVENRVYGQSAGVDWWGSLLLLLALGAFILGLNQLPVHAMWHADALWFIIAAVLLMLAFIGVEHRVSYPIIPSSFRRNGAFWYSCLLRFLSVAPFYVILFVIPALLEDNFGLNPSLWWVYSSSP